MVMKGVTEIMSNEELGTKKPNVLGNWISMTQDEKIGFLTNPSAATITALTEFLKEYRKPSERIAKYRAIQIDALIKWLDKGDRSVDEVVKISKLIDGIINEADRAKNNDVEHDLIALIVAGSIASIVAGTFIIAKSDKKLGRAMIAIGSTALLSALGADSKTGKALMKYLADTSLEEVG